MTDHYEGPERRISTPVTRDEFDALAIEVHKNTDLTADIHAMIRSFKILGAIAKVVTAISAAMLALWHAGQALLRPAG